MHFCHLIVTVLFLLFFGQYFCCTLMATKTIARRGIQQITKVNLVPRWGGQVGVIDPTYALVDPFIFLVHHTHSFARGERSGFPAHPHRGFETVTYVIDGGFDHGDTAGNKGRYGAGDVQWMTAGRGVLHSEMFVTDDAKPTFHGFQLWLNLAAKDKMCEPSYSMMYDKDIPTVTLTPASSGGATDVTNDRNSICTQGEVWLKVVHGRVNEIKNVTPRNTIVSFFHVKVGPASTWINLAPDTHNAFVYVMHGEGYFGDSKEIAKKHQYVIFAQNGNKVEVRNEHAERPLEFIYLEGVPLKEPFAHRGPFVMNTQQQLMEAFMDLQMGKFGQMEGEDDD